MTDAQPLSLDLTLVADSEAEHLADEARLRSLARAVLETEGASGAWEIAVALVGDDALQSLHRQFMDIDEPTDIMTFPYGEKTPGGDLAISIDHAVARAAEWENTPGQEIEFLVAHGILHLLGWQDTSPEQREAMLARQTDLVRAWRAEVCN
ncbi:MAG: rRNA maturation RNase YbeY [Chloroflexia bacterium]|nr:rRNA maturation RNase YbeY [Chloroflexia bacterium]